MRIWEDSTISIEPTDVLIAETKVGRSDLKVFRDVYNKYWIARSIGRNVEKKSYYLEYTVPLDAVEVIQFLVHRTEILMLNQCSHT